MTLETGSSDTVVNQSGQGVGILYFEYTVAVGHLSSDLDYKATNSLTGTIKDLAGNNMTLTLASPGSADSLGANKNIVVDGVAPSSFDRFRVCGRGLSGHDGSES